MSEIKLGLEELRQPIVEAAVGALFNSYDLRREVASRAAAIADGEIRERLTPIIEEAIANALQPTDSFGNPKGEPLTLHEVIAKRVEAELRAVQRDSTYIGGRRGDVPLLQMIIEREVAKVVGEDLREAMNEARKRVQAAVEQKGAEVLAETIARLAR